MIRIIKEIVEDPKVLSENKVVELSRDIIKGLEEKGATYYEAHKIVEEHIKVLKKTFDMLGHNALYALADEPVKFLLKS